MLIKTVIKSLVDLFFPSSCIICSEYLKNELYVCENCLDGLKVHNNTELGYIAVFDYGDDIRKLIHELKYNSRPEIGFILGKKAAEKIDGLFDKEISVLIPVPLHKKRKKKRGYNQSEFIAAGFSDFLKIPVNSKFIAREKNNVSQTTLNKLNRAENVKNIFTINENEQKDGKLYIVVDDLITTQATTKEIYKLFELNGYKNYYGLCIASPSS